MMLRQSDRHFNGPRRLVGGAHIINTNLSCAEVATTVMQSVLSLLCDVAHPAIGALQRDSLFAENRKKKKCNFSYNVQFDEKTTATLILPWRMPRG